MKILLMAIAIDLKDEEIGLAYISSSLKEAGYETKLVSIEYGEFNCDEILEYKPDLIGICLYPHVVSEVEIIVNELRKHLVETKVLLGGYFATYCYYELMFNKINPDYILIGEGEEVILKFLNALEGKCSFGDITNIVYKFNNQIQVKHEQYDITERMCRLYPDRDVLVDNAFNCAKIVFTRSSMFHFSKIYFREISNIVNEIVTIYDTYHVNRFDVLDDGFQDISDAKYYLQIFKEVRKKRKVFFYLNISEKFDMLDREIISCFEENGLIGVHIDLQYNDKSLNIENYIKQIESYKHIYDLCIEMRFALSTYIPFFRYDYTIDQIKSNLELLGYCNIALESNIDCMNEPLKNTPLWSELEQNGYIIKEGECPFFAKVVFLDIRVSRFYEFIKYIINKYYDRYTIGKMYQYTVEYQNLISFYIRNDFGEEINKMIREFNTIVQETVKEWSNNRVICYSKILCEHTKSRELDTLKIRCESIFKETIDVRNMNVEIKFLEKQRLKIMKMILVHYGEKMV